MYIKRFLIAGTISLVTALGWNLAHVSASVPGVNEYVDQTSTGTLGNNGGIRGGSLNHDGRYVAFASYSNNLVSSDTNNKTDVFVKDRTANTITRVSVSSSGTQANGNSSAGSQPSISDDGRYVAFASEASNLVSGDTNSTQDIFLHDMQTGTTELISSSSTGTLGNDWSDGPHISGDGKFVVFSSQSTNLVSTTTTYARSNIYVKNIASGNTQIITKNATGTEGNGSSSSAGISCDGGIIVFASSATNLPSGDESNSPDGSKSNVFIVSRAGGDTFLNITDSGNASAADPVVSCDGMHVAYDSSATNLVAGDVNSQNDIFKYDRRTGVTTRVSEYYNGPYGNDGAFNPTISADGRLVAYDSDANNIDANGDTNNAKDVFMKDTLTNAIYRVSINSSGQEGNAMSGLSYGGGFSGDGKYLYFIGLASNLVSNDTDTVFNGFLAETGL